MKTDEGLKKRLKNLKHIKKGQVLNPLGGKAHNQDLRKAKQLSNQQVAEVASVILNVETTINDLKQMVTTEEKVSPLQRWIAAVTARGISKGDVGPLTVLLDRICGKVPDKIDINSSNKNQSTFDIQIVREALLKAKQEHE